MSWPLLPGTVRGQACPSVARAQWETQLLVGGMVQEQLKLIRCQVQLFPLQGDAALTYNARTVSEH